MKLTILDNGCLRGRYTIFYEAGAVADTSDRTFPVSMFLIETCGKKILFDAGVYPGGIRANTSSVRLQNEAQTLEGQLALCGLKPADLDAVVISHLHYDHAGSLFLLKDKVIYTTKAEYDTAMRGGGAYDARDFNVGITDWRFVEGDTENLFPGVDAVTLPGHTPGMLGLVLHFESGRCMMLVQDAAYSADNYYPKCMIPGILADKESYLRSLAKMRELQQKYDAKIIFGHDMAQHETLRIAPDCYAD